MTRLHDVWAVVPVKNLSMAKQRLACVMKAEFRSELARTMLQDVLAAVVQATGLAGIAVVTADPIAADIAKGYGARILSGSMEEGQTAAIRYAMQVLADEGREAALTLPIDIPLITSIEIEMLLAAAVCRPDFVIVPAHDRQGSNAILCAPPGYISLSFGNYSFLPHLETARRRGVEPKVIELPGIGLDIDNPADVEAFLAIPSATKTRALLNQQGSLMSALLGAKGDPQQNHGSTTFP